MYYCEHCRSYFEEPNHRTIDGETWGICPDCGSMDYDEAVKCAICGTYFPEDQAPDGVCEDCLYEAACPEDAYEVGEDDQTEDDDGTVYNGFVWFLGGRDWLKDRVCCPNTRPASLDQAREYLKQKAYSYAQILKERNK